MIFAQILIEHEIFTHPYISNRVRDFDDIINAEKIERKKLKEMCFEGVTILCP